MDPRQNDPDPRKTIRISSIDERERERKERARECVRLAACCAEPFANTNSWAAIAGSKSHPRFLSMQAGI